MLVLPAQSFCESLSLFLHSSVFLSSFPSHIMSIGSWLLTLLLSRSLVPSFCPKASESHLPVAFCMDYCM